MILTTLLEKWKEFLKHNSKVHVIKFSIFPKLHEKRRLEFRRYMYELDKTYCENKMKQGERALIGYYIRKHGK